MRRSRKARNRRHTIGMLRLRNAARADAAATECTGLFRGGYLAEACGCRRKGNQAEIAPKRKVHFARDIGAASGLHACSVKGTFLSRPEGPVPSPKGGARTELDSGTGLAPGAPGFDPGTGLAPRAPGFDLG